MKFKEALWTWVLDPVVRRIESRLAHYESLRRTTHDGRRWIDVATIGPSCLFYDDAALTNQSAEPASLRIGSFCHVRGEISVLRGGRFSMGSHCFVGPGSRIWARQDVAIGNHVLISHLVDIHDSDSHALQWQARRQEGVALFEMLDDAPPPHARSARVVIEDDVWIGFKSTILKGVTIGRGAVVAASSVVTQDVPPLSLVAGNPARVIRELEQ